ncbi:MAG: hypothetical protein C4523_01985 [Myxococcales bacterium]|nr:MAG: hypothetical protein C4523_01985 [Myxococcales bacterium]
MTKNSNKQTSHDICLYRQLHKDIDGGGVPQQIKTFPFSPYGALNALRTMRRLHETDTVKYGFIGCGNRWLVVREAGHDVLDVTEMIEIFLGRVQDGWVQMLGLELTLDQEEMDRWLTYVELEE